MWRVSMLNVLQIPNKAPSMTVGGRSTRHGPVLG